MILTVGKIPIRNKNPLDVAENILPFYVNLIQNCM